MVSPSSEEERRGLIKRIKGLLFFRVLILSFFLGSTALIYFFRGDAERKKPGSTYDPFEDQRLKELATFGGSFYELKVFQFDLRSPGSQ